MKIKNKDLIKSFDATSFLWSGGMGGGAGGVAEDLLTTKGDTHGYTTENARVPVGADGQVITADSTDPLGLAWATPSGASASDSITAGGITATLGDWVLVDTYVPTALTSLVATTVDDTSIALTYSSITGERVKTVQVDYSTDNVTWTTATTTAGITSYTITGLTPDTPYYIRVYPSNIIGQGLVTQAAGTTTTYIIPNTPANFALSAGGTPLMSVDVSWDLSTVGNPAPLYTLERSADNVTFTVLSSTIPAVDTSYNDSTNPTDTLLYYRLKATNAVGDSAYTSTETINIPYNPVSDSGNSVANEGGGIVGYNTYTYLTSGTSSFAVTDPVTVEVLLVAGGGSAGSTRTGGGGGGGVMQTNTFTLPAGSYSVVVGAGATGGGSYTGNNGGSSTFNGITCTGGNVATGYGGAWNGIGSVGTTPTFPAGITGSAYGGTSGLGGVGNSGSNSMAGGGGAGTSNSGTLQRDGGAGVLISGFEYTDYYYGGGGGRGTTAPYTTGGNGGSGGGAGGKGSPSPNGSGGTGGRNVGGTGAGGAGGANTGGGGGGRSTGGYGSGGSGIIVIKVTV